MKWVPLPVLAGLALLGSCEKIKTLKAKLGSAAPATVAAAPQTGELVSEINEGSYDTFRQQRGRVVVVDFYADWCGPCRQLAPILRDIATGNQGLVRIGKVNVDKAPVLASGEGVKGIPDVRIFRDGTQVDRFVGLPSPDEVRKRIEVHLKGLTPLPEETAGAAQPKAAEPLTRPMRKDWMPEGVKRR